VVHNAPLVEDKAIDICGTSINTVVRARKGDTLKGFESSVFDHDVRQWIPDELSYALHGVDHKFVLILAPSVTVPGAFHRLGMVVSTYGIGGPKNWEGIPITRVTFV